MARGKDGALGRNRRTLRRSVPSTLAAVVSIATLSMTLTVAPLGAATPLAAVDVAAFSSRAEAWTSARDDHRDEAQTRAVELAEEARQAELDRIAAEEAAREAELARQRAAEEAARTTTTTTTRPPTTTTAPTTTTGPAAGDSSDTAPTEPPPAAPSGTPSAAQWEALRQCEASGNYTITSPDGRYRGAYQFSQATWDWVAGLDEPSLVGVDPIAASPAEQDAMALSLWQRQGWRPWPICGQQAAAA